MCHSERGEESLVAIAGNSRRNAKSVTTIRADQTGISAWKYILFPTSSQLRGRVKLQEVPFRVEEIKTASAWPVDARYGMNLYTPVFHLPSRQFEVVPADAEGLVRRAVSSDTVSGKRLGPLEEHHDAVARTQIRA